jgi:propionyl-CoA carboxylase alpha chain
MIKASAGGGGKGMRIARSEAEIGEGWQLARSEAKSSFGDDRVFIERYIENPRHIEIQVLADKHGNALSLGERECSIQRRNQKIVEESPSPALDAGLRKAMGEQAVALAKAVGYDSAGTVEFVFGQDRKFYFLEMNTRLQVEHPVTEFVTGLDLVEQMIRIAAGEALTFRQADIRLDGWAIESRLYAEDPYRAFLPSIGRLDRYKPPAVGTNGKASVRLDGGVVEGSEISIYFDPLIAKLIVHAPDRAAATDAMADALDRTVIDGIRHNQPFLSALMAHPRWREGRLSTSFIPEEFPDGFRPVTPDAQVLRRLARIALAIELKNRRRLTHLNGHLNGEGGKAGGDWIVGLAGERIALKAADAQQLESAWRPGEPLWIGTVDGVPMTVQVRPTTAGLNLSWRGVDVVARPMSPRLAALESLMPVKKAADTSKFMRCPMPGLVIAIHAEKGQKVRAGEPLAIVEAMKMENVLRAERDLTVKSINVKPGDTLAVDAIIMEFE